MLCRLTSVGVSGKIQQQDVAAEVAEVVEVSQVLLQLPIGQLGLQDGCQVTKDVGVQRRWPAVVRSQTENVKT